MATKTRKSLKPSSLDTAADTSLGEVLRERIAARAYELYLKRGLTHGRDVEDWFEAKRLVALEMADSAHAGRKVAASIRRRVASGRLPAGH